MDSAPLNLGKLFIIVYLIRADRGVEATNDRVRSNLQGFGEEKVDSNFD
jgi:hypothetical protein